MRFAHLSDIHIRSNSRHDEYRTIFEELYEKLRSQNIDRILITGDIAHTKTQEAPEFYNFTAEFFTKLAIIAPVDILLGNHDGNLLNKDRLDVITPIVTMLNNPRINLYKNSKRIDINDEVSYFVYSVFDKSAWNNWKIDHNKINIALFHGTVSGARTDQDFLLDSEANLSEFDRYDFAFLGDIHRMQNLAERDCFLVIDEDDLDQYPNAEVIKYIDEMNRKVKIKVKKQHIKYSGSLVQQNYGEDIEKGYLIWDIRSKCDWDVDFVSMTPVHPFFTFEFNSLDNIDIEKYKFIPTGSRIRLKFLKEFDARAIEKLARAFKHDLDAKEVVTINDLQGVNDSVIIDSKSIKIEDLRNPNVQNQLIQKYLEDTGISADKIVEVLKINNEYNDKLKSNEQVARNIKWKINELQFSNIFAFKDGNKIEFDKLKGIVGIFGPNTIGKSALIDIILYGIYNANSKEIVKNLDIINTRKDKCNVKLSLELNNRNYVIERMTTRMQAGKRSGSEFDHARTDLDFYIPDRDAENGRIPLNGLQRQDTDKIIRQKFGTAEDFLATCVAAQGDMNQFIDQKSTRRKETIAKFLDLEIFEARFRLAKDEISALKAKLKTFGSNNFVTLIEVDRTKEKEYVAKYNEELSLKQSLLKQIEIKKDELLELKKSYESVKSVDEYHNTCNELNVINKELAQSFIELETLKQKFDKMVIEFNNYDVNTNEIERKRISTKIDEINDKLSRTKEILINKNTASMKHDQLLRSVELLHGIPCGDKFPDCKFIKDSYDAKQKISEVEIELQNLRDELAKLNKDALDKEHSHLLNLTKQLSTDSLEHERLEDKIKYQKLQIKNEELKIHNNETIRDNLHVKKTEFESRGVHKLESAQIKSQIALVETEIRNLRLSLETCEKAILTLSRKQGEVKNNIKNLIDKQKDNEKTSNLCYIYELYAKVMSKYGIQKEIILNKLSYINSEIDKLLRNVAKFKIKFVDDSDKLDIYIDYSDAGGPRIIETASGAEKTLASMAIRVALTRISTLPKPNIFIIDESFGVYDEQNKVAISKMLQLLKNYFTTVLIVTHVDDIKDCVDYILTIERDADRFSYLS